MRARLALALALLLASARSRRRSPAARAGAGVVADVSGRSVSGADVIERVGTSETVIGRSGDDGTLLVPPHDRAELFARLGTRVSPRVPSHEGTFGSSSRSRPARSRRAAPTAHAAGHREQRDGAGRRRRRVGLGLVPNYRSQREGGSGRQTLNGVPLELPTAPRNGGSGDEPGIPSDLVESFSAAQADDGSVSPNYHVLAPSATTEPALRRRRDAVGRQPVEDEPVGDLAQAGLRASRGGGGDDGALAHDVFADASGSAYDHSTRSHHLDGSLSLAYAIGSTQINVVAISSHKRSNDVLTTMPGALASGEGPGNDTRTSTTFGYVIASASRTGATRTTCCTPSSPAV